MRKIRDVLECIFTKELSHRETAQLIRVNRRTVTNYLDRFKDSKLPWPLPDHVDNEQLESALFPALQPSSNGVEPIINFAKIHTALAQKGATLAILHQEWRETISPEDDIGYSQFCRRYNAFRKSLQVSMRQTAVFGEVAFVDYSGKTLSVTDPNTGELKKVQIFVGVLGGSNYTFCEATWTQTSRDWIASHTRMFEFFGGVPRIVVPDNLKSAVTKADRFSPIINESYSAMCRYYGTHPFPARPREPKDKSKAEAGVLLAQRWILFTLRSRKFFSLAEMNREISILLEKLNSRPFQKLPGSRFSKWLELEQPTLSALPAERYEFSDWGKVRAAQDYHVCVDRHFYSVPHHLKGQEFEYCLSAHSLDLLYRGKFLVTHTRSFEVEQTTTLSEHQHPTHRALLQWSEPEALEWAMEVGPNTNALLQAQLAKIRGYLLGYRITQAMKQLFRNYGKSRLEEACTYAVKHNVTGTLELRNILSKKLDQLLAHDVTEASNDIAHQNIRGADYYSDLLQTTNKEIES